MRDVQQATDSSGIWVSCRDRKVGNENDWKRDVQQDIRGIFFSMLFARVGPEMRCATYQMFELPFEERQVREDGDWDEMCEDAKAREEHILYESGFQDQTCNKQLIEAGTIPIDSSCRIELLW
jgi:hypothetical protein